MKQLPLANSILTLNKGYAYVLFVCFTVCLVLNLISYNLNLKGSCIMKKDNGVKESKETPIDATCEVGSKKYAVRLDDTNDGVLTVSHPVFTGNKKDKTLKFLGNVSSNIFNANEQGIVRLIAMLQDASNEKRFDIVHTLNRQTLSDDKNNHRTAMTREAAPLTQLKRKLQSGQLTKAQEEKARALFTEFDLDLDEVIK